MENRKKLLLKSEFQNDINGAQLKLVLLSVHCNSIVSGIFCCDQFDSMIELIDTINFHLFLSSESIKILNFEYFFKEWRYQINFI